MTESGFRQLRAEILQKLHDGLDPRLTYHSVSHTQDVLYHAERIAISENVSDVRLLLLIKIASLFHDTGFLCSYKGHEEKSCEIMLESLDHSLFEDRELELMKELIMATKLPQNPVTLAEMIICDADLDYLGRDDFKLISERLKQEFLAYGVVANDAEWDELQIRFIENHLYFTATSINDRCQAKMKFLKELKQEQAKENP